MNNFKNKKNRGFSLLETTVAVAILVVAILGPLTLASSSIRSSSLAKDNLIAAGLAQEGVELVRNFRDNNILKGQNWLSGLGVCFSQSGCTIDAAALTVSACGSTCPPINLDQNSGIYNYNTGSPTAFIRTITASTVNGNEIKIISTVGWPEPFGNQQFEVEEFLLNW